MIGFAALPKDPKIGESAVFVKPAWKVPVYRISKNGKTMVKGGSLAHKTSVLVTGQQLKENGKGGYTGWLEVLRLDTGTVCYLQAACFVTVPYWNLPVSETPAYGYCIAAYRESPGTAPRDGAGKFYSLRDGVKVLIPFTAVSKMPFMVSQIVEKKLLIASQAVITACLMFSQRSIQNCRKPSFVFHR